MQTISPEDTCVNTCIDVTPVGEINRLHHNINASAREMVKDAVRIGELLTEQKAKCGHGEWLPWLKANVEFDRRTATNYMRLHRDRVKWETVSHLTLTEAYALLAEGAPKRERKPAAPKPEPEFKHDKRQDAPPAYVAPDVVDDVPFVLPGEAIQPPVINPDDANQSDKLFTAKRDFRALGKRDKGAFLGWVNSTYGEQKPAAPEDETEQMECPNIPTLLEQVDAALKQVLTIVDTTPPANAKERQSLLDDLLNINMAMAGVYAALSQRKGGK